MRRYETIIITDPDLSAEQRDPILQRVADVVNQGDGYLALTDEWGARKLAYEIKKKDRGYYVRFDFCGTGAVVNEMERFFRIDDRVLKYMTVLLDKSADIEKIKEEIAAAQSEAEKAAEQAAAAAAHASSEEPAEAQTETAATQTSPEEPGEAQTETAAAQTSPEEPAGAQTESDEIRTPSEEPAETEETQTPESETGENEAAPEETEEEKK
ncbi:MAG: 30S ribosomal protein S6 [Deltaproteobacteria bacterium]|jgi:small subunit ribosomal protein S6